MNTSHAVSTTSTVPRSAERLTLAMLHTLLFIHRFRHVTAAHVLSHLSHTQLSTSNQLLIRLRAKGLIDRHYTAVDRAANRPAVYYVTPAGVAVLKVRFPEDSFRRSRSIAADYSASPATRLRHLMLTDVYTHFKRHHDGEFVLSTAHDLAPLKEKPDYVPDGYIRLTLPGVGTRAYFIELYGWGRSSHVQQRRLHSYLQFFEASDSLDVTTGTFIITANAPAQARLHATLALSLEDSFLDQTVFYTTTSEKLVGDQTAIWRAVE